MKQLILTLAAVAASVTAVYGQGTGVLDRYYIDGLIYEKTSETTVSCEGAFDDGVKKVVIPETVNIDDKVFTVTGISEYAFSQCKTLSSITIPKTIASISSNAFSCYNVGGEPVSSELSVYISDLTVWCKINFEDPYANPLSREGSKLYANGILVTDLKIPDGITEIKPYSFYGLDSMTSLTLSNSVSTIGDCSFCECSELETVVIGGCVTYIGRDAFKTYFGTISNLKNIEILASIPPKYNYDTIYGNIYVPFSRDSFENAVLSVPTGSLEAYKSADVWKEFKNIQEKDFGGVDGVENDAVSVTVNGGSIEIGGADNALVEVYNLSGQLVYSGTDASIGGLSHGIYIVRVAGQTFKVAL